MGTQRRLGARHVWIALLLCGVLALVVLEGLSTATDFDTVTGQVRTSQLLWGYTISARRENSLIRTWLGTPSEVDVQPVWRRVSRRYLLGGGPRTNYSYFGILTLIQVIGDQADRYNFTADEKRSVATKLLAEATGRWAPALVWRDDAIVVDTEHGEVTLWSASERSR